MSVIEWHTHACTHLELKIGLTLILLTEAWTNFSLQDKTWAEFSTLEVAAHVPRICAPMKQKSQT